MVQLVNSRKFYKYVTLFFFIGLTVMPSLYMYVTEFGFQNYQSVFLNHRQISIFFRTIIFGLGVSLISLIISIVSFILECTNLPLREYLSKLILIPLIIPPYISTIAWMELLGKRGDLVSVNIPIDIYNLHSAIIIMSLSYFPLLVLILSYAIRNVDFRLEEAARQFYGPFVAFRKVTLSLITPHVIIGSLFIFILTISEYGSPSLLQVHVFMTEIFAEFSAFFNMGNAVVLSLPLLFTILLIIFLINYYTNKKSYITITSFSRRRNVIELSILQKICGFIFILILVFFSAIVPLSTLVIASKFKFFEALITAYDSFFNSLWMACLGATLLTIISFFLAYYHRRLSDPLILAPLSIPSAMIALGLIKLWNQPATTFIYSTPIIILLGYLARFLPFVTKTFSPFFEQIHPSIEENARLSNASFPTVIRKIIFPLMKPAFVPVWIISFILSLRELEVTLLVTPPGFQTLPNRIYTLLHYGNFELVSALCILVIILIMLPLLVIIPIKEAIKWATSNSRM